MLSISAGSSPRVEAARRPGFPRPAHGSSREAIALYRGDFLFGLFLKDSPAFEEWQAAESEGLKRDQGAALRRLIEIKEGSGEIPRAAELARRLVEQDALEESSHRTLMRLEALEGRRSAALRQYLTCRRILERELGQAPEEETEKLREAIAAGRLAPRAPRAFAGGRLGTGKASFYREWQPCRASKRRGQRHPSRHGFGIQRTAHISDLWCGRGGRRRAAALADGSGAGARCAAYRGSVASE